MSQQQPQQQQEQHVDDVSLASIKTNTGNSPPDGIIEAIMAMLKIDNLFKQEKTKVTEVVKRTAPEMASPEVVSQRKFAKETKKKALILIKRFMIEHQKDIKYITVGERFLVLKSKRKISDEVMNVFATAVEARFKTAEFVQKFGTPGMTEHEYIRLIQRQQLAFLNDVIAADKPVHSIGLVKKLPTDSIFDQLNAVFAALPSSGTASA
jgi:hypothetical protein